MVIQIHLKRDLFYTVGPRFIFYAIEGVKYVDIETRLCMKYSRCENRHFGVQF